MTVIVPVYDAAEHVRNCLESIVTHTMHPDVELLVIDDASPDPAIPPLLDEYERKYRGITVVRNVENLGFLRTMNRGFGLAEGRDVVMLNSDTIVTSRWLLGLCAAASDPSIGTVTALSNNAWAFSGPKIGYNEMPAPANETARAIRQNAERRYPQTPSGHGFCMLVKRAVLDDIIGFDEMYGRGYCEENDLSMRAGRFGWRHVVDDSTLVEHVGSVSFAAEKPALLVANRAKLDERFPEYTELIEAFVASPEMAIVRARVAETFDRMSTQMPLPRVLHVIDGDGDGERTPMADFGRDRYEPLTLCVTEDQLVISHGSAGHEVERVQLCAPRAAGAVTDDVHDPVGGLLAHYAIEVVHVHHWPTEFDLLAVCTGERLPIIASVSPDTTPEAGRAIETPLGETSVVPEEQPASTVVAKAAPATMSDGRSYADLYDEVREDQRSFVVR